MWVKQCVDFRGNQTFHLLDPRLVESLGSRQSLSEDWLRADDFAGPLTLRGANRGRFIVRFPAMPRSRA
jgi:hypothetical protein